MKIDKVNIGPKFPPYVIAEMSCNHGGSLDNAKKIIRMAKLAKASAIKTQCYEPQTITLELNKPDFIVQEGLWKGRTLWELYKKAHTPFDWHPDLYRVAKDSGITIFSSVFDMSAIDHLEKLNCPAYKIASMELVDIPLIEYAASTGKPMIISTGMGNDQEIKDADQASGGKAAFLHCMSEYPGTIETSNLGGIRHLQRLLPRSVVGLSDHSEGSLAPIAAVAVGACIIEKHFGHLPDVVSEDDEFSMGPRDFAHMVNQVRQTYAAMQPTKMDSNPTRQVRRSLYAIQDIKKGEKFSLENIGSIRPGYGLPCKLLPSLIGRKAGMKYRRGDALK
jgi:N-acetylneuraminate synthase